VNRGLLWLLSAVESGRFREASPIGFYFAKLWYFEKLYPLIFTVAALGRARVRAMMTP
jgi:squalene-hopene/tetraprenyl-beta-curcumene cyclase